MLAIPIAPERAQKVGDYGKTKKIKEKRALRGLMAKPEPETVTVVVPSGCSTVVASP
jgi:hypothetical protein